MTALIRPIRASLKIDRLTASLGYVLTVTAGLLLIWPGAVWAAEKVSLPLVWDHQVRFAGFYAAARQGDYAEAGLEADIRSGIRPDGAIVDALEEVTEGRADFGIGAANLLVTHEEGEPVVVLAALFQRSSVGFLAKREIGATSPADLLRLGVARNIGSFTDVEFQAMSRAEGIDPSLLQPFPLEAGLRHLIAGHVDVIPGYTLATPWLGRQHGLELTVLRPAAYGVDFYGDTLFAHGRLIERDPDLVSRFTAATLKGWEYALEPPEEIARRVSKELPRVVPIDDLSGINRFQADEVRGLTGYPIIQLGHVNPERWRRMHDLLKAAGAVRGEFDPDRFIFDPERRDREWEAFLHKALWSALALVAVVVIGFLVANWALRRSVALRLAQLGESEARYARAVTGTNDGIWDWNVRSGENYFSPRWHEMLGYDDGALAPAFQTFQALVHPDDRDEVAEAVRAHLEERVRYDIEFRLRREDGAYIWVRSRGQAVWDDDGEPLRMAGSITDITEPRRAKAELARSEARFRALLDHAPVPILMKDLEGRFIVTNTKMAEWYGVDAAQMPGKTPFDAVPAPTARKFDALARAARDTGEAVEREIEARLLNGDQITVMTKCFPILDQDGETIAVGAIDIDITERKRAEQEARLAKAQLDEAIEAISEGFLLFDAEERLILCNSVYRDRIFPALSERLVPGMTFEEWARTVAASGSVTEAIGCEEAWVAERLENFRHPSGPKDYALCDGRWLQTTEYKTPSGGTAGVRMDVTERKRAEEEIRKLNQELEQRVEERTVELRRANEALVAEVAERESAEISRRESQNQLQLVTDAVPALISYVDREQRWRFNNRAYESWFGQVPAELRGRHVREGLGEAAYAAVRPHVERALNGETARYEASLPYAYGGARHVEAVYVPDIGQDGEAKGFFSLVTDISERRRLEAELVEKQRLATVGQLTATVSHELRNPLGTIKISAAVVDAKARDRGLDVERALDRINRNVRRCDRIIDELLDYARSRDLTPEDTLIDPWLEAVLDDLAIPEGVTVRRRLGAPGVSVALDRERFQRAVINVYENACQAMAEDPDGEDTENVLIVGSKTASSRIEVAFRDTGPGIPDEAYGKIFDPLFSTRSFGVGVGLTTVKQILEKHGGGVSVATDAGQGTEVCLWLPMAARPEEG